jgi:hypothetical protein
MQRAPEPPFRQVPEKQCFDELTMNGVRNPSTEVILSLGEGSAFVQGENA